MKRIIAVFCAAFLVFTGCSKTKTEQAEGKQAFKTVTDTSGRSLTIPSGVKSIVCVNVGALRFTSYMRALDLVVGVEQNEKNPSVSKLFSYVNRDIFSRLPVTGDNGITFDEEIIKLSPDVIVAAIDGKAADNLSEKTGIPVVTIPLIDNVFDGKMYETLRLMGEVYNKQERAAGLTGYLKGLEADIKKRTGDIPEADKPAVYVGGVSFKGAHGFEGTEAKYSPFYAIGAKNLADRTGQSGAFNIDVEEVLKWDPDIIFLDFNGMPLIKEDYAKRPDFYEAFSAVKNKRVYSQISFRFNAVNVEIALADTYYAGKVIFPEQFADVDPAKKADEIFEMMLGVKCYELLKEAGWEFRPVTIGE
ncbi:MAG: iron ABC transporter substrate-binding protein [Spirochaetaceae bacterium]|jgi:iron complex transport system substrate-binding protein|nr:iron ABC transporter substrate-binding protein [Spirochaetaceae bacterium]